MSCLLDQAGRGGDGGGASEVRKKRSSSAGGDPCYGSLCRPPNVFQTTTEPSKSDLLRLQWLQTDQHEIATMLFF